MLQTQNMTDIMTTVTVALLLFLIVSLWEDCDNRSCRRLMIFATIIATNKLASMRNSILKTTLYTIKKVEGDSDSRS